MIVMKLIENKTIMLGIMFFISLTFLTACSHVGYAFTVDNTLNDVGLTSACSYYTLTLDKNENAKDIIANSDISEIYAKQGTLNDISIQYKSYDTEYYESPIYSDDCIGTQFNNQTKKNETYYYKCQTGTETKSRIVGVWNDLNSYLTNNFKDNYKTEMRTKIVDVEVEVKELFGLITKTEIQQQEQQYEVEVLDNYKTIEKLEKKTANQIKKDLKETLKQSEDSNTIELRVCGSYDFELNTYQSDIKDLATVSIDHIPIFDNQAFPEYAWWSASWGYRKAITVNTTLNVTDYQVLLNVSYESAMQSDFDDLRFTDENDVEMDYWIEDKSDDTYADV